MHRTVCALRSLVFLMFMAVTVIPWATAVLLVSIFVRGDRVYWMCAGWLTLSIGAARVICGVKHRMHGLDHLAEADRAPAVILLPKHQSTWETFAFPGLMPHPLAYVFKRELHLLREELSNLGFGGRTGHPLADARIQQWTPDAFPPS